MSSQGRVFSSYCTNSVWLLYRTHLHTFAHIYTHLHTSTHICTHSCLFYNQMQRVQCKVFKSKMAARRCADLIFSQPKTKRQKREMSQNHKTPRRTSKRVDLNSGVDVQKNSGVDVQNRDEYHPSKIKPVTRLSSAQVRQHPLGIRNAPSFVLSDNHYRRSVYLAPKDSHITPMSMQELDDGQDIVSFIETSFVPLTRSGSNGDRWKHHQ